MTWEEEVKTYNNDGYCGYCDSLCGPGGFCSDECYEAYENEMELLQEELRSEYPREKVEVEEIPELGKDSEEPPF